MGKERKLGRMEKNTTFEAHIYGAKNYLGKQQSNKCQIKADE
jgi:hypothetical protein